ncbi:complex III assembly factor LYRM7 [Frankliniella occidentalis]|uniref:Complex III assembly factor LYRM7 n=1 Tax=Frankliniella occidentalis TaxID=133901 RepID=A0A6J1SVT2_FRAOC|nr:complex III assembly factor LYRM7 [Frankliniella occidentalis]
MASKVLRKEVLAAFRKLHKTRQKVFRDDIHALTAAREKINEEFRKNIAVRDESAIKELVDFAKAVEYEMRTTIVQAVEVAPGRFAARITEDTQLLDNVEFDITKIPDAPPKGKRVSVCCQDPTQKKD